ncbi:MAG: hypothetical protein Q4G43_11490 [Mobilicoccus sp.]|nr:hypothetical protein [Mobilicoccus sp.]
MHVVVAEDRPNELVGVRLLVLSLQEHSPEVSFHAILPGAPDEVVRWLEDRGVSVSTERLLGAGWNVKPHALLARLDAGEDDVVWIDSDVIVTRDVSPIFAELTPQHVAVTEDCRWGQAQGGTHRTLSWGLPVGRSMPVTANTAVLRVTREHVELLRAWVELLSRPEYTEAQGRPPLERPIHHVGDQEVFTALLGSEQFASVPIRFIRRGSEIAQLFGPGGYTTAERLRSARSGLPPFVHAMGQKPWRFHASVSPREDKRAAYDSFAAELSPYRHVARRYRADLPGDLSWLDRSTVVGGALNRVLPSTLAGLPLAVVDEGVRWAKARMGRDRYAIELPVSSGTRGEASRHHRSLP